MKILSNAGYFLKETATIIRLSLLSHIFSLFSTGLILFIFAMVISGWCISNEVVAAIQGEAEINVYFTESAGQSGAVPLVESIRKIEGVREARVVEAGEAYDRMVKILGPEAGVLKYFDDNPFSPFIEIKINLEKIDPVLDQLGLLPGIEHIRDNREVLDRLRQMAGVLSWLGLLVVAAVGVTTLVIISHIIRLGIYNNREQITTLRLLGAPEIFIAFPFLLEGLLLTLGGGLLAAALAAWAIKQVYAQVAAPLPFIPLPPREELVTGLMIMIAALSATLGMAGSLFGLASARKNR